MVDIATEALGKLMREKRMSARQVAQAAGHAGVPVSEDTVMRVLKRERKPSFEFGMWLVGQAGREAGPAQRVADTTMQPDFAQLDPVLQELMEGNHLVPRWTAGASPQSILLQIKQERERVEVPQKANLIALLSQLLERLESRSVSTPLSPGQQGATLEQDPAAARERVIRRIEEQLIKDVDEAAAVKLELSDLKKHKVMATPSGSRGRQRGAAAKDADTSAWQDELRKEMRSLAYAALAHEQSEDIAGLRRSIHALIDCGPYCKGVVLEADYERRLCQLIFVMMEYRFQEASFEKVYRHFASVQELLIQVRRGPLGQELVDYSELRSDLVTCISEAKWRDSSASRDILLSPEEITKLWKINEQRLRPVARSVTGTARINWEMRLGLAGVSVLKLALRYIDRAECLDLLDFFNRQTGLALDFHATEAIAQQHPAEDNESHHQLLRTEWRIGRLFTLDYLLRERPAALGRAELDRLQQERLQLSASLPYDPASYQRGIDLEYRWMLAHMARATLHVAE